MGQSSSILARANPAQANAFQWARDPARLLQQEKWMLGKGKEMLVLTRKVGERLLIGDSVVVEVLEVLGGRVRFGIRALQGVPIMRQELLQEANAPPDRSEPSQPLTSTP